MYCSLYLRKGVVYIPTSARVDKAFYRGIEPVAVVDVSDHDGLVLAFKQTFARGNPDIPNNRNPDPVTPRAAGLKSWSAFERGASTWSIEEKDGNYQIVGYRKAPPRGWAEDPENRIALAPGTSVDELIERMIAILQAAAAK